ncbi:12607_t:CDS:1, partial [Ambispora gerdemannii]
INEIRVQVSLLELSDNSSKELVSKELLQNQLLKLDINHDDVNGAAADDALFGAKKFDATSSQRNA